MSYTPKPQWFRGMSHIGNNQEYEGYQQNNRQVQAQVQQVQAQQAQFERWAVQTVDGFARAVQAKDSRFEDAKRFRQYFEEGLRKMLEDLPTYQPEEKQREVKEQDEGDSEGSDDDDSDGSDEILDEALDSVSLKDKEERSPMEDEASDEQVGDCSICYNSLTVVVDEQGNRLGNCVTLSQAVDEQGTPVPCGHSFHEVCIEQWFSSRRYRQCPLCRAYHGDRPQPVAEPQPEVYFEEADEVPIVDPRFELSSRMVQNAFDAMGHRSDLNSLQQDTSLIESNYTSEDLSRRITLNHSQLSGQRENHRLVSAYNLGRYLTHYIRLHTPEGENPPSLRAICASNRLSINPTTASQSINFSNIIRRNGALRFLLTSTALWGNVRKCCVMMERRGVVSYLDRAFQEWRTANPDSVFLTDPLQDDDDDAPTADEDSD